MTIYTNYIVYPEGELQEINHRLTVDSIVDINGVPLELPLRNYKIIAYRVCKISHKEERGEYSVYHYLELIPVHELRGF